MESGLGRLADRPAVYSLASLATTVPIRAATVLFLLPGPRSYDAEGVGSTAERIARDAALVGATPIPGAAPWVAFVWHPGPGVRAVRLEGFRPLHGR